MVVCVCVFIELLTLMSVGWVGAGTLEQCCLCREESNNFISLMVRRRDEEDRHRERGK